MNLEVIYWTVGGVALGLSVMVVWARIFDESLVRLRIHFLNVSLRFFSTDFAERLLSSQFASYVKAKERYQKRHCLKELLYGLKGIDGLPERNFDIILSRIGRDFVVELRGQPFREAVARLHRIADIVNEG